MTGFSSRIDAEKARELGIQGFLMKPVAMEELARTVRTVLDQKRSKELFFGFPESKMGNMDIVKVLIVDHEESVCSLIADFLKINGYNCRGATDPLKALDMLKDDDFDLVISGIRMKGMDGLDLTREIRKIYPSIDTIVMSGNTEDYEYSDIIEAGAIDFIGEPLSLLELKAKIARVNQERIMFAELREANEKIQLSLAEMTDVNDRLRLEIAERVEMQKELYDAHKEIESLLSSIPCILIEISKDGTIKRWNSVAESILQIEAEEVLGRRIYECPIAWETEKVNSAIQSCAAEYLSLRLNEIRFTRKDGKDGILDLIINLVREGVARFSGFIILGTDITEYKLMERQLAQAQKLESIGQLAAGIAHEINTPAQYVGDNVRFLQEACRGLESVHDLYDQLLRELRSGNPTEDLVRKIEETVEEVDLGYIRQEAPKAVIQSLDGIGRISGIVRAMKDFSHPGTDVKTGIDLNKAIESTITVARNEWKYVAEMATDFDPGLPLVPCLPAEINQVILNIIINASHAVADALKQNGSDQKGTITIGTRAQGEHAEIRISDTGTGIPENIRSKIFDPFFTTKGVGKGTGQGLAISHSVVVGKHGGTITFDSEAGKGATFVIRLPLKQN